MRRSLAVAFMLLATVTAASAAPCGDPLQDNKSQQNAADEAQVRGDLKAGSECATDEDKKASAKKNEDAAEKLKREGKVHDGSSTTGQGSARK